MRRVCLRRRESRSGVMPHNANAHPRWASSLLIAAALSIFSLTFLGCPGRSQQAISSDGPSSEPKTQTRYDIILQNLTGAADFSRLFVSGNKLYAATGYTGLKIYDVGAERPALITTVDTPGTAVDVCADGDYLFVADHREGLVILRRATEYK
jgi:hypothetical protein